MPRVELGRPATFDDLVAVPEILVAEIIDGELWTSPRPTPRHAAAHTELGARLRVSFASGGESPGGWRIYFEPELHLAAHVLVPDIAGWRRQRLPRLPDTAYFAVAPDWLCEVVSPSTEMLDRSKKLRIYAEHGVGNVWLVDPLVKTLEVLRLERGHWTIVDTFANAAMVRAEPFEALALQLAWLWEDDG